jgi:RNA polymerase sigma-70 factor, ECF subfamily
MAGDQGWFVRTVWTAVDRQEMKNDDPDDLDPADDTGDELDAFDGESGAEPTPRVTDRQRQEDAEKVQLLKQASQGNEQAFTELIGKVRQRVYAYVWGQLRNHVDVDEAVGETWVQMWKAAAKFQGRSTFDTWVIGIARHRVLMQLRSNKNRRVHVDLDSISETVPSESLDPADVVHASQLQEQVKKCIAVLGRKHRECFSLLYCTNRSHEEAALIVGVPVGTIKTRMLHATQAVLRCARRAFGLDGPAKT